MGWGLSLRLGRGFGAAPPRTAVVGDQHQPVAGDVIDERTDRQREEQRRNAIRRRHDAGRERGIGRGQHDDRDRHLIEAIAEHRDRPRDQIEAER